MKSFQRFFNESFENPKVISEGGAYGHMSHIVDDPYLTFGDLKKFINDIFTGHIQVEEKTDGQNLQITYKNGRLGAARNKTTIKNPMTTDEVASKFAGRGPIKDAFVNTMSDLENAINTLSNKQKDKIFKDGQTFINIEIIYPPTKNVIDYGSRAILQFHGAVSYDTETGKKLAEDKEAASLLRKMIQQRDALKQKTFEIIGPVKLKIGHRDFSKQIKQYTKELSRAQGNMSDSENIGDYISLKWSEYINKKFPNMPDDYKAILVRRWGFNEKAVNISQIKSANEEYADEISDVDKKSETIQKEFMTPLELVFLRLGADYLANLNGFLSSNPNKAVKGMSKEIDSLVKEIKADKNAKPETLQKLEYHLGRLQNIGMDKLVPTEGVVFKYKGKVFKLTGLFASINQILGTIKFSR